MTRLYGRAPTTERVNDYVPDVRFKRTSIIATVGLRGVIAPIMFKGTLNGDFFGAYVEQALAPELSAGDILILDNCSPHKVNDILEPLHEKGASSIFLPEYSPDLNPAEPLWSKVKSSIRKQKPRTPTELETAMRAALNSVTYDDIVGWFEHYGYMLNVKC